ncbi:unnamed protein product [Heligmosomoides polygyrus]|uniref:Saposin B-type domain-containing protein n=1 Tax=Heligmosomoides polygyrus TaxID=6339 RepID=A0A183GRH3_HELPZ|nr:unnamed protein product [Heligmosomoides polygyrus]
MKKAIVFLLCCALGVVALGSDDSDSSESLEEEASGMLCKLCTKFVKRIDKHIEQGSKFATVCYSFLFLKL